ncbi:MAG: sigma-54-dependent Fis family transcriptional regulator [Deltaproteobacteria bacterium HGW-Deltaproteobacteria-12]|jgi:transcriptional regulator of acetoin/glycerol metabolism|nr:MAG: sigma-54-dependent Fis family transcriptional regulator [Deltaproteobacteria bacterium HGW-Deltaproteobacteria-12]
MDRHDQVLEVWREFIATGKISNEKILSPAIMNSWKRSRECGVDPYQKKVPVILKEHKLKNLLERNKDLIEICRPFIDNLYSFFRGTGFVAALADVDGYVIDVTGDKEVLEMTSRGSFVTGALWSEDVAGTNMIPIVLRENKPCQLRSTEHYCWSQHRMSGVGAPISNPAGQMLGVLVIFGPYEKANPHTLGMVVAATHAINNYFHVRRMLTESQISNKFQKTVIESIPEALIAVSNEGYIALANENARKRLSLPENITGKQIRDVIEPGNGNFLSIISSKNNIMDMEVQIIQDRKPKHYLLTCNPILDAEDNPTGKIIILIEIVRARTLVNRMIGAQAKFSFKDVAGNHPRALETISLAKRAARTLSNVLLLGESGTGKNIFAQAIHNESNRAKGPFVSINCAAIPRELIASELFGYSEGAFTGSKRGGNQGKFELSDGGTLCLDEIGEMPLDLQTTLLSVIEDKSIVRIGGREVVPVDVRIIATTNKNLKEEVKKGNFREDLYYRLNVFTIEMVPLREMKSDIALLARYFADKMSARFGDELIRIDDDVISILTNHSWPGNVRELQNVIERSISVSLTNVIAVDDLPPEIRKKPAAIERDVSLKAMERQLLLELMQSKLSKTEIARKLNVTRCTLYRKLKVYGIPYQ